MSHPAAILVAGLGFGDEGKGTVVDALVERTGADLVVRYNGGAQAEHNVVMADGRHHTFSQFGAGTLRGARTLLGPSVLVDPIALVHEARHLQELGVADPFSLLHIHGDAPIITPYHRAANIADEKARGAQAHGSTGRGIGRTREYSLRWPDDAPRWRDLTDIPALSEKLRLIRMRLPASRVSWTTDPWALVDAGRLSHSVEDDWLAEAMRSREAVIFEGAQGVLLDQTWGFRPHVTWSDTTFGEAYKMLEGIDCDVQRLGVTRTYATRHGAGPLPTEGTLDAVEPHNVGGFAGAFRTGAFDRRLFEYALEIIGGVDALAVTHLDRADSWLAYEPRRPALPLADRFNDADFRTSHYLSGELVALLADIARAPVVCRSYGPTAEDKVWSW